MQTILNLARNLGMDVVAEGTESAGHVERQQALGCDFAQGYFFSKPVDSTKATALLAAAAGEQRKTTSA